MGRYVRGQLRHSAGRALTLALGILVAAASFSLLTAAASTSEVRTRGEVSSSFRAAYDILVRPRGTLTDLEREQGLVRPNFETGIFGGIREEQWRQVLDVPGVEAAAPVAYLGYPSQFVRLRLPLDRYVSGTGDQLFRLRTTWLANGGLSRYPGVTPYVLVTGTRGGCARAAIVAPDAGGVFAANGPAYSSLTCYELPELGRVSRTTGKVSVELVQGFPLLVAAVDPVQEDRLLGLDQALVDGSPLTEATTFTTTQFGTAVPVIASARTFQDETLEAVVERVDPGPGSTPRRVVDEPALARTEVGPDLPAPNRAYRRVVKLPGTPVGRERVPFQSAYERLLDGLATPADPTGERPLYSLYWSPGQVEYIPAGPGRLAPRPVTNSEQVYYDPNGVGFVPPDNQDVQFRALDSHAAVGQSPGVPGIGALRVIGTFDPERLPGAVPSGALNQVPLEAYAPPLVTPADEPSRRALGGRPLGPTANLGGYVSQPPALLTTLEAAKGLTHPRYFDDARHDAPISVIRVKVAGVTGPDERSLELIRRAATEITTRTGLAVDITAGSSPQPQQVALPAGRFGQPPLLVTEGWSKKGVAVVLLRAVDRKSAALFTLVLIVTAGFLANAALATVRSRRREIGVLLSVGWTRWHIFRAVLGELALIGLLAGAAGAALSAVLIRILALDLSLTRVLLVPPVAVALAVLAGLIPAALAAHGRPVDVIAPAVTAPARRARVRSVAGLALANLRRRPGRLLVAAGTLFLGVGALTALLGINAAFQQAATGTLLGDYIATQVRAVDYLAVGLALALAGLSVADMLALEARERAPELRTLQATGWSAARLASLTLYQAGGIGLLGGLAGAAAGLGFDLLAGAPLEPVLPAAAAAASVGVLVATLAALAPALLTTRAAIAPALADD